MELQQETAKSAVRLFRLLFAFPGDDGKMQTADDPFLRQLKGMIDAFSGNDGEADFSDYFNSIYRRWGENVRRELLAAFFDTFVSAGVVPGNWSWEGENERFLLSECRSFIKNLLQIREMLPQYGVLPGARRLFEDLEELTDAELLADAIAGADRFLVGRVFRFIGRRFEAVEPDSAKDVGKFFGFPGVRSSFQDHFHKYSSGMSNVPLLIHSLPGYGKTSMTISYALAEKDIVLILPEPEALEEGWHALMEPLTARRDLKFVVFFDIFDGVFEPRHRLFKLFFVKINGYNVICTEHIED